MTVIPLGAGLPRRSSHLPADLSEPLMARQPARAASAYLVLLRVEVTAFHPLGARRADKSARRSQGLVSVALFLVFAEGKPTTSTYGR